MDDPDPQPGAPCPLQGLADARQQSAACPAAPRRRSGQPIEEERASPGTSAHRRGRPTPAPPPPPVLQRHPAPAGSTSYCARWTAGSWPPASALLTSEVTRPTAAGLKKADPAPAMSCRTTSIQICAVPVSRSTAVAPCATNWIVGEQHDGTARGIPTAPPVSVSTMTWQPRSAPRSQIDQRSREVQHGERHREGRQRVPERGSRLSQVVATKILSRQWCDHREERLHRLLPVFRAREAGGLVIPGGTLTSRRCRSAAGCSGSRPRSGTVHFFSHQSPAVGCGKSTRSLSPVRVGNIRAHLATTDIFGQRSRPGRSCTTVQTMPQASNCRRCEASAWTMIPSAVAVGSGAHREADGAVGRHRFQYGEGSPNISPRRGRAGRLRSGSGRAGPWRPAGSAVPAIRRRRSAPGSVRMTAGSGTEVFGARGAVTDHDRPWVARVSTRSEPVSRTRSPWKAECLGLGRTHRPWPRTGCAGHEAFESLFSFGVGAISTIRASRSCPGAGRARGSPRRPRRAAPGVVESLRTISGELGLLVDLVVSPAAPERLGQCGLDRGASRSALACSRVRPRPR